MKVNCTHDYKAFFIIIDLFKLLDIRISNDIYIKTINYDIIKHVKTTYLLL